MKKKITIFIILGFLTSGCSSEPGHNYSSSWSYDATSHWHACTDQGFEELKSDIANHTFNTVVTEPTYTNGGYTTHTCSICNYSYKDNETNPLIRKYTITWNDYDGTTLEVDRDLTQNSPLSYDGSTPTREDYHFRGWSYNGTKVFDEKGNKLVNITISSDMTFIALYSQTAIMTITKNIEEAGSISGEGEYPYNTYVDVSATPNQGYKFIGWYYENTLLSNNLEYKYIMWDQDVNLEARFALDSFKLNIHTNNETYGLVLLRSNTNNEYKSKYEEMRDYTSTVQIAAYSNTDVRFLGWYNEDNELVYSNAVQSFAMPNHNLTLEAKWNYFKITYNLNGGTNSDNNPSSYTVDDGVIALSKPTKTGYTFLGWRYHDEYITSIDTRLIKDITLDAIWSTTDYSITYHLNGGTNNVDNLSTYTIESSTIDLKSPTRDYYDFKGWYTDAEFEWPISSIQNGSYGDVNVYAKWEPIVYNITYNLNGGTNSDSNPSTYTIEDNIILADATKQGYVFTGWYDSDDNRITTISARAGNIVLTAHWYAILHNLSVTSEDTSKGIVSIASGSGYTDETITVVATPIDESIFKGWYSGDTKISNNSTYTFTMPNTDYSLVAHFWSKLEQEEWDRDHGVIPVLDSETNTITYGLYPQTNVNDPTLLTELNKLTTAESNGWYQYQYEYYVKISAEPLYSDYKFNNSATIVRGATYWFKCEPITWNILSNSSGTYYLLSSMLLDVHCYCNSTNAKSVGTKTVYPNNYEYSDIRAWLNGYCISYSSYTSDYTGKGFLDVAFSLNNSYILTTTVDNSAATTESAYNQNQYVCRNTQDKIFLPSYQDYENSDYGFTTQALSTTRECKTTDYTRARGAYYNTSHSYLYNGNYWTRSPDFSFSYYAGQVRSDGANYFDSLKDSNYNSVRPAITLVI